MNLSVLKNVKECEKGPVSYSGTLHCSDEVRQKVNLWTERRRSSCLGLRASGQIDVISQWIGEKGENKEGLEEPTEHLFSRADLQISD